MYDIERGRCIRIAKDSFQKLKKVLRDRKMFLETKKKSAELRYNVFVSYKAVDAG